jgi:hypothetical protein
MCYLKITKRFSLFPSPEPTYFNFYLSSKYKKKTYLATFLMPFEINNFNISNVSHWTCCSIWACPWVIALFNVFHQQFWFLFTIFILITLYKSSFFRFHKMFNSLYIIYVGTSFYIGTSFYACTSFDIDTSF